MLKGFAAHSNKLKASRNQNFYDLFGGEFKIHTANHKADSKSESHLLNLVFLKEEMNMSNFANSFRNQTNRTKTENGADVYASTGDAVLDLFARIGGMRNASEAELNRMYLDARNSDKELADNMILYARDIRNGGIGERKIARTLLKTLALRDPAKVGRNFDTIVTAGRWDDLFVLMGTSLETQALDFMQEQFRKDITSMKAKQNVSLLAKWLPSANTSSNETRRLARRVYTYFGITERTYRKTLSALRKYLDIVEKKMSANEFGLIDYSVVPSVAMTRYRSAFGRHDFERFDKFLNAVERGETKINAATSYPYDLIMPYIRVPRYTWRSPITAVNRTLEAQWKALPNYVEGNHDVIVMADVSGSMEYDNYKPMATSVSLGIYFAERNKGDYQNLMLTFTDVPRMLELNPNATVASRVDEVMKHVGYNTNLDGAFKAIFEIAVKAGSAPAALVVISDGEIDKFYRDPRLANDIVEKWRIEYARVGLVAPKLIMWNVESRGSRFVGKSTNPFVSYVSGSSASTFKELTTLINEDAVTAMKKILSHPAFQWK